MPERLHTISHKSLWHCLTHTRLFGMNYEHKYHFLADSCIYCGNKRRDIEQQNIICRREKNIIPITHKRAMQKLKEFFNDNQAIRSTLQHNNTNSE